MKASVSDPPEKTPNAQLHNSQLGSWRSPDAVCVWRGMARGRVRRDHGPALALGQREVGIAGNEGAEGAVRITMRWESPCRHNPGASDRVLHRGRARNRSIPAGLRTLSGLSPFPPPPCRRRAIVVETDPVSLPDPTEEAADLWHLRLRIYECRVVPWHGD